MQFFHNKRATIVEVLHTVDALLREGRQLVFAADRPAAELHGLGPALTARLQGGMACRIDSPDIETRRGVLRQLAKMRDVPLDDDVIAYVADRFVSHVRSLIGAVNQLVATSRVLGQPVTLSLAKEALQELLGHEPSTFALADIERAVCRVFGMRADLLKSNRRTGRVSHPRMLAMWLARKYTRAALSEIGTHFGCRSHSTVVSAQKRVEEWVTHNRSLRVADGDWAISEAIRRVEETLRVG